MSLRFLLLSGLLLSGLTATGMTGWWWLTAEQQSSDTELPILPTPPLPWRISQEAEYELCLAAVTEDPSQAIALAETWKARGGGDAATHCEALAQIASSNPSAGAILMETIALGPNADPTVRATVLSQAVQARLLARQPARALELASDALRLTPASTDLLIQRATAAKALGRRDLTIEDLTKALGLSPTRADILVMRASTLRALGRLDLAAKDLEQAISLAADDPEILLERGILRQRMGNMSGARADWRRILELDPDSETADLAEQNLALLDAGPPRR
jgi:tetratricopeptide (TPR) repeat protein